MPGPSGTPNRRMPVPDNSGFMVAAYVALGVLYCGYAVWLVARGRKR
jgi:hypothetical protein